MLFSNFYQRKSVFAYNTWIIVLALFISSCSGPFLGAGSSVGLAALEERSARQVALDLATTAKIRLELFNSDEKFFLRIGVEVFENRVLLTGIVKSDTLAARAVGISWKPKDVVDVLNEIQIGEFKLRNVAKDSWISTQFTSKITFDRDILAINYKIETVNGVIYLIGVAQSSSELQKVLNHAKNIGGVNRVINHVRIKKPSY